MKKALKWTLLFLGVPAVIVGGLAVDTYFRAVSAIATHDARLKVDIAAFRAKHQPFAFLKGRDVSLETLDRIPCPAGLFHDPSAMALEGGHAVHEKLWWIADYQFVPPRKRDPSLPTGPLPIDAYLTALAITVDLDQGGFTLLSLRTFDESLALKLLAEEMARNLPGAEKLRNVSIELDQLLQHRPPFETVLTGEHLLDRVELLNVILLRRDPLCWIRRPPGWREFFSWRILIAKCMNEREDEYRRLRALPPDAFPDHLTEDDEERTRSRLWRLARDARMDEQICLGHWTMARLATAILRYRTDQACDPSLLQDLVPAYLPTLPTDPTGGFPFSFAKGLLKYDPTYAHASTWDLRAK